MVENKKKLNKEVQAGFGDEENEFGEMEQSFEALFEESLQALNVGDVVKGTIVQVNPDSVIVDVGFKSEGVIPLSEFFDEKGALIVQVGDVYDVLVERTESETGLISLSQEKADRQKIWNSLGEGAVAAIESSGRTHRVAGGARTIDRADPGAGAAK